MKKIFCLHLTLVSLICISQNIHNNERYYFNDAELTKKEFESLDSRKIYVEKSKNDSVTINKIFIRKKVIKIDSIKSKQIEIFLSKIIGSDFNPTKKTMIHLYRTDKNIYSDANYKKYWQWINTNSERYQAFLIGTKNSGVDSSKNENIYFDPYNFFENLFFRNSNFKINHLLIKPDGEIYFYYGIDDILSALDWSVD